MPEVDPIVPTAGVILIQVVPTDGSVNVAVAPTQILEGPAIGAGTGYTVTDLLTVQPDPSEYEIIAVPADTPVTRPLSDPTIATPGVAEVHNPPDTASDNVIVDNAQTVLGPLMATGEGLTVTIVVI